MAPRESKFPPVPTIRRESWFPCERPSRPGRVAARTPPKYEDRSERQPRHPAARVNQRRPVAASKISSAPSSSTMNSLSSRKRLVGVAISRVLSARHYQASRRRVQSRVVKLAPKPVQGSHRRWRAGVECYNGLLGLVRRAVFSIEYLGEKFSAQGDYHRQRLRGLDGGYLCGARGFEPAGARRLRAGRASSR